MVQPTNNRGRLARAQETREHKRREKDFNDAVITKYYAEQRHVDAAAASLEKDSARRLEREARARNAEQAVINTLERAEKQSELRRMQADEEGRLATAVLEDYSAEQRQKGELADLHARHDVLRDLAIKLKTAQVSRERALQRQEAALITAQEREYEDLVSERLEAERRAGLAAEHARAEVRRAENFKAREKLEEQMGERVAQQREAAEEHARERAMVDAVMAAIEEEDRLEVELRAARAAETRSYIADFIADREARREAARRTEFEEERKIQEHLQEAKRREDAVAAAAAAKREEADRIYEHLRAEREAALAAAEEEDFLIDLLHQEENEARARASAAERAAHKERIKQEMIAANQRQLELKAAREAERAAEEDALRRSMLAKFAEDDRLEQMNAQRRRMRQLEHRREADRLVAEKRALFEQAQVEQAAWEAAERAREARELSAVEAERRRMLRDAAGLLDYLPKGVLQQFQRYWRVLVSPVVSHFPSVLSSLCW